MLWHEDFPMVEEVSASGKVTTITVIAGQWHGQAVIAPAPDSWAADPANHVGIFMIRMEAGSAFTIPAVSSTANRNLYFYKGKG